MNFWRPEEVYIVAQAIEAMVFRCERTTIGNEHLVLCTFQGRESLRINLSKKVLALSAMSGTPVQVYAFKWYRPGDYLMWWAIKRALKRFDAVVDQIKLHDYRAFFANHIQELLVELASLMEKAEAEQRSLLQKDKTEGGKNLHPQVEAMLQVNTEEEESMYVTDEDLELESPHDMGKQENADD